jgi:ppGpp synthetase/RelA/SpoT-type nucleotidyltranferase
LGLIDDFIARYTKEYDFYDQAGRIVAQRLEANLQAAGVRSIVTSRAKAITRLEEKCIKRQDTHDYTCVGDIFDDIVDLAGVRVALYFPAERAQVGDIIAQLFHVIDQKEFPESGRDPQIEKRFSGYWAAHYRIQLREQDLSEPDRRYAVAKIEIQVASVLMHAWSEVEHDLVYKPLAGELSDQEHSILDQINGLVMSGEIALELLQKAGQARVATGERKIPNHYDLAVHLLGRAEDATGEPISTSGLGRVDLLFDLITQLGIDTPDLLKPYLEALHGNVEVRPLAEQVIDAILAEDQSRYEVYEKIRSRRPSMFHEVGLGDEARYALVGAFMARWIELEKLLRELKPNSRFVIPTGRELAHLLDPGLLREFDGLRRMRNELVHGIETPSPAVLNEAIQRLGAILAEIKRRATGEDGSAPSQAL